MHLGHCCSAASRIHARLAFRVRVVYIYVCAVVCTCCSYFDFSFRSDREFGKQFEPSTTITDDLETKYCIVVKK